MIGLDKIRLTDNGQTNLVKDHPVCAACGELAVGFVVPCQHLTCAGLCYSDKCVTCTGPGWDQDHDDNHILAPGCGADGCHTDFRRICRVQLSGVQIMLENYFDRIHWIQTFHSRSQKLLARWEDEIAVTWDDSDDEGSDMSC